MTEEKKRRKRIPTRESLKGLTGWKDKSDEDFEESYQLAMFGALKDQLVEEKINRLRLQYEEEYDLSELLPNDRAVLATLIQSTVLLDLYQNTLFSILKNPDATSDVNITKAKSLGDVCNKLTNDISKMQGDLAITKKDRKNSKEASVINFIEDLKVKAKKAYLQKMCIVICENCSTVLASVWTLYSENKAAKIHVHCSRKLDDGHVCGFDKEFTISELYANGGCNRVDLLPESLR
jgi:ribosomal protein L30E